MLYARCPSFIVVSPFLSSPPLTCLARQGCPSDLPRSMVALAPSRMVPPIWLGLISGMKMTTG